MQHNVTGHGYGVQRAVRATRRISATHNRPTGLGALLNPTPAQVIQAEVNRREGIPENWAGPAPKRAQPDYASDPKNRVTSERYNLELAAGVRTQTTHEFDRMVARYAQRCKSRLNPLRSALTEVPQRYRAAVLANLQEK